MVADSAAAVAVLKLEAVGEPRGAFETRDARHVAPGLVAALPAVAARSALPSTVREAAASFLRQKFDFRNAQHWQALATESALRGRLPWVPPHLMSAAVAAVLGTR